MGEVAAGAEERQLEATQVRDAPDPSTEASASLEGNPSLADDVLRQWREEGIDDEAGEIAQLEAEIEALEDSL